MRQLQHVFLSSFILFQWAIYPLTDNVITDVYHYQVSVYTGVRQNSGTTSKVYFVLGGEDGDTEVRLLQDQEKRVGNCVYLY